ncbi:MAG: zinc dependent phospholipase C family protein [Acidobacteria bacterium]|nr:zinc dependent phospholipase C family protein [Acidobacteriota bacterium]
MKLFFKYIKNKLLKAITILVVLIVAFSPNFTFAWSGKGHVIITRMAVKLIIDDPNMPSELKAILIEGLGTKNKLFQFESYINDTSNLRTFDAGLDSFSIRPDTLTASKSPIPAFGISEPLTHYMDTEFFQSDVERQKFLPNGANKIKPTDLPRNPKDERYQKAGFITFRTEQCYKSLVSSFKENYSNDQVFLWIGYLSHYVADSYQPFHSTIDYQGHECSCNKEREKKHNLHGDLEGLLFEDTSKTGQENREKFLKYFQAAIARLKENKKTETLDPYLVIQDALFSSYDYLPMLCRAGDIALGKENLDANKWFNYKEKIENREISVLEMKAERMAESTIKIRDLIIQAWNEAQSKNVH